MAKVREWREVHWLGVPDDFLLGDLGQCLGMAGCTVRRSRIRIGFGLKELGGTTVFVSVRLDRDWERQEINQ